MGFILLLSSIAIVMFSPPVSAVTLTITFAGSLYDTVSGTHTVTATPALNDLIKTYNIARETWLTYRNAVSTQTPSDIYFQRLTQDVLNLNNAIRRFEEGR